ncbi:MAG: hypothetical protein EHM49_02070 [Deltaproteobacteria bacterium]|nr:MAG: hypothetical protein EHM49_02070 [Deltaproteobacteria bacterium]
MKNKLLIGLICITAILGVIAMAATYLCLQGLEANRREIPFYHKTNVSQIRCMSEDGELDTYWVVIPNEVKQDKAFLQGYCSSLGRDLVD